MNTDEDFEIWPGTGQFVNTRPINQFSITSPSFVTPGITGLNVTSDPDSLHPDQSRYKNLTNNDVRRLQKMLQFATISVDHAINRLEAVLAPSLDADQLQKLWNEQNYHCWWGKFHPRKSQRGALRCLPRYHRIRDRLTSPKLRFKLRTWGFASIAPPHTWRIYLADSFFQFANSGEMQWNRVNTLIHEAAHLTGVLRDTYYRAPCIDLAQRSRALARTNADNYAFFAIDSYRVNSGWLATIDSKCDLSRQSPSKPNLPVK